MDGNRQVGFRNCDDETMFIHASGKRAAGFSNVKSIAFITLDLVDKVHRLAVNMSCYGESEVGI